MAASTTLLSPVSTSATSHLGSLLIAITTGNSSSSSSSPVENLEDVYRHLNSSIDLSILLLEGTKKHLLEGCLIISALSLVASFLVYCLLSELRTVPGKCLMGLIISELITDILVVAALQFQPHTPTCFVIGVLIHFFFLTIISWTSVIGKCLAVVQLLYTKITKYKFCMIWMVLMIVMMMMVDKCYFYY